MRLLYYIPFTNGMGADRWIYQGWKNAFLDLGHQFQELAAEDDWIEKINAAKPDLLLVANFINFSEYKERLLWARSQGIKVMLILDWNMNEQDLELIKNFDIADIYYGEKEPESMASFEAKTGRKYHLVANAADKTLHFPANPVKKYEYDIVYLGANLVKKRRIFKEVLRPLSKRYKVGIFGPGWTMKDKILAALQFAFRRAKLRRLAEIANQMRITVPAEDENKLYSSAKISLNFHEREEDGSQPNYIVNQRAFKIAACGGFQICDYVPALRKYFSEDEVVMATTPGDFIEKVGYFLSNDNQREAIAKKGSARSLRDHTFHNRVQEVIALVTDSSLNRKSNTAK